MVLSPGIPDDILIELRVVLLAACRAFVPDTALAPWQVM